MFVKYLYNTEAFFNFVLFGIIPLINILQMNLNINILRMNLNIYFE